jgi:16S rRNA (adenine1518-N6/adenine1519-N6)-dimethyltransferase
MNLNQLKKLLSEHDIFPSKNLDQHFLVDDSILKKEVEYAGISELDTVLEIGPGPGILTEFIIPKAKKVIVIEKDLRYKEILENLDVEVIIDDALKVDFPTECNKIISNLPYGISSQLTFKILEFKPDVAVLCYQKEFANRMIATPASRNYSRLSVNCTVRANVERLDTVPKGMFWPMPEVDSAIVRLTPKQVDLPEHFDAVCRALFQHKNKKVRNALIDSYHELSTDKEKVKSWADSLGEIKDTKVINLRPDEIIMLSDAFHK